MDAVAYDENYLGQIPSLPVIVTRSETTLFERWETEFGRHELMSWSGTFPGHQPLRLMLVVHAVPYRESSAGQNSHIIGNGPSDICTSIGRFSTCLSG